MLPVEGLTQLRSSRASLHCPAAGPACLLTSLSGSSRPKSGRRTRVTSSRVRNCLGTTSARSRHIRPHWPGSSPNPAPSAFRDRASSHSSLAELPCAMSAPAAAPASDVEEREPRGTSGKPYLVEESAVGGGGVICVTGFGQFDGVPNNPTQTLVQDIQRCLAEAQGSSASAAAEACRALGEAESPEGSFLAHGERPGVSFGNPWSALRQFMAPAAVTSPGLPCAHTGPRAGFHLRLHPQPKPGKTAVMSGGEEVWLKLPQGWTLGHCQVLPVVGKGNLSNLRQILAQPLPSDQAGARCLSPQVPGGGRALAANSSASSGSDLATSYAEQGAALAVELLEASAVDKATVSLSAASCLQRPLHGRAQAMQQTGGAQASNLETQLSLERMLQPSKMTSCKRVIWMHLGVFSGLDRFHLEERAWNEADFRTTDESGWMPVHEPICPEDGSLKHFAESDLPLDLLAQELRSEGFPVATSTDAGRFVCNYVYYHSLRQCSQVNNRNSSSSAPKSAATMFGGNGQGSRGQGALDLGETEGAGGAERWSSLFVHVPDFSAVSEATQLRFLARLMELLCYC